MRVGVAGDLSSTGGPPGVCDSCGRDSRLEKYLIDNSVDAVDVAIILVSILDQLSVGEAGPQTIDACTVISPVFQEVNSITQKVLDGYLGFRVHLRLLLRDGLLRDNPDDPTAVRILLRSQHKTREGK